MTDPRDDLLHNLSFAIMDLETTGFGHDAGIVEIAAVRLDRWVPGGEFQSMVNPEVPIPPTASRVHAIDDEMVAAAPTFAQIAPSLAHFLQGAVIMGHNFFSFDLRFLTRQLRDVFGAGPDHYVVDTLPLARACYQAESYKLEELAPQLGIPLEGAHQAMSDVYATAELWLHLHQILAKRGVRTLEDLGRFRAIRKLDGSGLPRFDAPPPHCAMPRP